jgi:hypothetical protein
MSLLIRADTDFGALNPGGVCIVERPMYRHTRIRYSVNSAKARFRLASVLNDIWPSGPPAQSPEYALGRMRL